MQQQTDLTSYPGIPLVAIVVAMTEDRIIGSGEELPWHLPDDLQLFKRLTMGGTIMMGRKTYASIGRPLPGRHNIVLSSTLKESPGVQVCKTFMAGLTKAAQLGRPLFIIGGEQLYRRALVIATELHISRVKTAIPGDVFFPEFKPADWSLCEEKDYPGFRYVRYRRADIFGLTERLNSEMS